MVQAVAQVSALRAQGLRYVVGGRVILDSVDLDVPSKTTVAVTGPSGSGKTTLLMALAGILSTSSGRVDLAGTELTRLGSRGRASLRLRAVGLVYQFGELIAELTPLDNVALPAMLTSIDRRTSYARAQSLLDDLGVGSLATAETGTLSGGERQRVAVARALVTEPAVILADEPTGSLDQAATDVVADLLFSLPQRYGCALVVVTHNERVAQRADQRLRLDYGRLTEERQ